MNEKIKKRTKEKGGNKIFRGMLSQCIDCLFTFNASVFVDR